MASDSAWNSAKVLLKGLMSFFNLRSLGDKSDIQMILTKPDMRCKMLQAGYSQWVSSATSMRELPHGASFLLALGVYERERVFFELEQAGTCCRTDDLLVTIWRACEIAWNHRKDVLLSSTRKRHKCSHQLLWDFPLISIIDINWWNMICKCFNCALIICI